MACAFVYRSIFEENKCQKKKNGGQVYIKKMVRHLVTALTEEFILTKMEFVNKDLKK